MVTKKIRTEYMKKFRDPKWETFSKCYEDSLKYRLTRRVMEHSHRPWFWEGWDGSPDSSGWSTPRLSRSKVAPLSLPPPASLEEKPSPGPEPPPDKEDAKGGAGQEAVVDDTAGGNDADEVGGASPTAAPGNVRPTDDTETDHGPVDTASSDGEPVNPPPRRRRHRRRTPRSEPGHQDGSARRPPRAKSQPAISSKENQRRTSSRLDCVERQAEVRKTPDDHTPDACIQSGKRNSNLDRRRARSADLEKERRSQLMVVDDRWMTEYMRCFSARLR